MKTKWLVLLIILFLPGCYDFTDLKNTSFCFGIALDYGQDKKYHIIIETGVIMYEASEAKYQTTTLEAEGDTFSEAIAAMSATTSSLIDYTHAQLFIISKDIAQTDLVPIINDLFNNSRIQNNIYILISNTESAKEILKTEPATNASLSFEIIYSLRDTSDYYSQSFPKKLIELYNDIHSDFDDYLIPAIKTRMSGEKELASLEGAFVTRRGKITDYVTDGDLTNAILTQKLLPNFMKTIEYEDRYISFKLEKIKRKIDAHLNDIHFEFDLLVTLMHDIPDFDKAIQALKEEMEESLSQTFLKYKNRDVDIFRLKYVMYKYHPREYKKVREDDIYSFSFTNNIEITLKSKGVLQ